MAGQPVLSQSSCHPGGRGANCHLLAKCCLKQLFLPPLDPELSSSVQELGSSGVLGKPVPSGLCSPSQVGLAWNQSGEGRQLPWLRGWDLGFSLPIVWSLDPVSSPFTVKESSNALRTSFLWTMPRSTRTQNWRYKYWACPSAASTVRRAAAGVGHFVTYRVT